MPFRERKSLEMSLDILFFFAAVKFILNAVKLTFFLSTTPEVLKLRSASILRPFNYTALQFTNGIWKAYTPPLQLNATTSIKNCIHFYFCAKRYYFQNVFLTMLTMLRMTPDRKRYEYRWYTLWSARARASQPIEMTFKMKTLKLHMHWQWPYPEWVG